MDRKELDAVLDRIEERILDKLEVPKIARGAARMKAEYPILRGIVEDGIREGYRLGVDATLGALKTARDGKPAVK